MTWKVIGALSRVTMHDPGPRERKEEGRKKGASRLYLRPEGQIAAA